MNTSLRRSVDRGTFDAITCNRCGACCERFYLGRSALTLLQYMPWSFHSCDVRCVPADRGEHAENRRMARWLLDLEHVDEEPLGQMALRCPRLGEVSGVPTCTRYDERPHTCRNFPYGRAADYPQCAWYVDLAVVGGEPVVGSEAA